MLDALISECTDYDFKVSLELEKPKSWLKTVVAFANGIGGKLFFGVDGNKKIVSIDDPQATIEKITDLIDKRVSPKIVFRLTPYREDGGVFLELKVDPGSSTPYRYHNGDSNVVYIRQGSSTIEAPDYMVNELILKGNGKTYDGIVTGYRKSSFSFSIFQSDFLERTGSEFTEQDFVSFGLATKEGYLTNAGVLLADSNPYRQSRVFCTRWNGTDKVQEMESSNDFEIDGSLIRQLKQAMDFFKVNTKVKWHKEGNETIYEPDYNSEAILEALVNAIIHRNYNNLGAEVCLNIYDDRIEITSPGIMVSGDPVPAFVDSPFESMRRNPIIADVFWKMRYMNRRGSGLAKITNSTAKLFGGSKRHVSYQIRNSFFVVSIDNANYVPPIDAPLSNRQKDILDCLNSKPRALGELTTILGVDRKTVRNDLKELEDAGLVKCVGVTKGKHWQLI